MKKLCILLISFAFVMPAFSVQESTTDKTLSTLTSDDGKDAVNKHKGIKKRLHHKMKNMDPKQKKVFKKRMKHKFKNMDDRQEKAFKKRLKNKS